jgi:acyl-CoA dehydrogenase
VYVFSLGPSLGFEFPVLQLTGCNSQAEKALEYFVARANDKARTPFGKTLGEQGSTLERIAHCRIEIDAARLVVLNAATKIDEIDAKHALVEIAESKVFVPNMALKVIDMAIQAHGGGGVSQEFPLAGMWASGRTMRLVDGPDEVHLQQLGKNENKKGKDLLDKMERQMQAVKALFERYGTELVDPLQLDRESGAKAKL